MATPRDTGGGVNPPSAVTTFDLRDARRVFFWKLIEYLGLAAFLGFVPRSMGPELYGQFALVLNLLSFMWLVMGLGAQATFGRFVPEFSVGGRPNLIQLMFTQYYLVRGFLASILSIVLYGALASLFPSMEITLRIWIVLAFVSGAVSMTCFQVFYGLSNISRWLVRDSSRLLLVVVVILVLREVSLISAVLGLLIVEASFAVLGHLWARPFFRFDRGVLGSKVLREFMVFGITYFAANLTFLVMWRIGEIMVRITTKDNTEVAFFSIAVSIVMTFNALFGQMMVMLLPTLATFRTIKDEARTEQWLGVSLKYLTILAFYLQFVFLAIGRQLINVTIGTDFGPVFSVLALLLVTLIPMAVFRTAITVSVLDKQLRRNLLVGLAGLASYFAVALFLGSSDGGQGVALAMVIGSGIAALLAIRLCPLTRILEVARFWSICAAGGSLLILSIVVPLRSELASVVAAIAFTLLGLKFRFIKLDDFRKLSPR